MERNVLNLNVIVKGKVISVGIEGNAGGTFNCQLIYFAIFLKFLFPPTCAVGCMR